MHKSLLIAGVITATSVAAHSAALQQPGPDRPSVGDTSIFAPLYLDPPPNEHRTAAGVPGPKYWQNRANYTLHATLDTATRTVRGTMTLRYTNHSPDTLRFIWIQTEQNAFRARSLNSLVYPEESRFGVRGFTGGDVIERLTQAVRRKEVSLELHDHGTVTKVDLAQPLAPGHTTVVHAAWHFTVPVHGADRMGRDGTLYEIAQWYPRVCVYDDVSGWNTDPYLGQGEFYAEYGDFTLSVTVPAGYIVAATGTLDNPHEALTSTEVARLTKARTSSTPVPIITAAELASGAARPTRRGMVTWTFGAHNVRDAVWAASPDYQWDASSWHGILVQSFYRSSAPVWAEGEAADQARMSIEEYSTRWFQYPYPQISVVEGPVSGMEYPMLAMETANRTKPALYGVITHEVGHNWFPMIVGSNERIHFWQDEGFNTFINYFSEARRYPKDGSALQRAARDRQYIEQTQRSNVDIPIEIPADRIDPRKLGFTEYKKTAVGLELLREQILGPDTFDAAFREYIRRWAFKHPTPADFFRTIENVAGRRLDWFWREWFYEDAHFDQAIDTVAFRIAGDTDRLAIRYENKARGVLPILVRFTFTDGTTKDFSYPVEVWSMNTHYYIRHYIFPARTVARIELDPDHVLVDDDRDNNIWVTPNAPGAIEAQGKMADRSSAVPDASAGGDSVITALTAEGLAHYLAVKRALGPYWYEHQWLLNDARSSGHNVMIEGPGQPFRVGVFDYPRLVKGDSALAGLFEANDFPPAQFYPSQIAVYRALGQLSEHAVTNAALPDSSTPAGKNIALVYAHLMELRSAGLVAPTAPPAMCTEAESASGGGMAIASPDPGDASTAAGIPAAPDDVTVVPFYQKPNETPLEQTKAVIEAEIDGHRGVFIFDLGDTPTMLNRTFLQPNATGGVDSVTDANRIPDTTPRTDYMAPGNFRQYDPAHVTVRVGSLTSTFEDPEFTATITDGTHHYNVLLGHLWGNFGWVFGPRLGNLGPAVFQPFETIVDYTHTRVVLIRLDSAGHRVIDVPAYTRQASVPLLSVPTGLGKMSGLGLAVTPCNTLDTAEPLKNVVIKQIDTGAAKDGAALLGYPFLSSFGAFGINQRTHEFILYQ